MPKYNLEFKVDIVKKYNSGKYGGRKLIAKTFNIPLSTLREWIFRYNNYGVEGLKKKFINQKYSSNFKLSVIQYRKANQLSYAETANLFKIHNPVTICSWDKKYNEKGIDGLKSKQGRPRKMKLKKTNKNEKLNETEREELIRLREEKRLLELQIIYEKKLQALLMEEETKVRKKQK